MTERQVDLALMRYRSTASGLIWGGVLALGVLASLLFRRQAVDWALVAVPAALIVWGLLHRFVVAPIMKHRWRHAVKTS